MIVTTAASPDGLSRGGAMKATSGSAWIDAANPATLSRDVLAVRSAASKIGPLKPGPKPLASRSYARRVVSDDGSLPWSAAPRRIENTGRASVTSTARLAPTMIQGRFWIWRLHRKAAVSRWWRRLCSLAASFVPANPMMAGTSVTDASIVMSTASTAPTDRP